MTEPREASRRGTQPPMTAGESRSRVECGNPRGDQHADGAAPRRRPLTVLEVVQVRVDVR